MPRTSVISAEINERLKCKDNSNKNWYSNESKIKRMAYARKLTKWMVEEWDRSLNLISLACNEVDRENHPRAASILEVLEVYLLENCRWAYRLGSCFPDDEEIEIEVRKGAGYKDPEKYEKYSDTSKAISGLIKLGNKKRGEL